MSFLYLDQMTLLIKTKKLNKFLFIKKMRNILLFLSYWALIKVKFYLFRVYGKEFTSISLLTKNAFQEAFAAGYQFVFN